MAQYRATIEGQRGIASRLGSKKSGLLAKVNGWNCGIEVEMSYDEEGKEDVINVYLTSGSSQRGEKIFLGKYTENHIISYLQEKRLEK